MYRGHLATFSGTATLRFRGFDNALGWTRGDMTWAGPYCCTNVSPNPGEDCKEGCEPGSQFLPLYVNGASVWGDDLQRRFSGTISTLWRTGTYTLVANWGPWGPYDIELKR